MIVGFPGWLGVQVVYFEVREFEDITERDLLMIDFSLLVPQCFFTAIYSTSEKESGFIQTGGQFIRIRLKIRGPFYSENKNRMAG